MGKKLTEEEYVGRLEKLFPNIKLLGHYTKCATKVLHRCLIHNYDWEVTPNHILMGRECPKCKIDKLKRMRTKTHTKYVEELKEKNPNIEVLGVYTKATTNISHQCKICGHIWDVEPNSLLQGTGCPVCAGRVCGRAPKYLNSIWSSEHKDFFSKYLTEEQMKTYMPYSNQYIDAICPDCKKHKKIEPRTILNYGFGCVCGDGVSYPNKFVCSVLDQLHVAYETEYVFDWAKDKRYDIYIPALDCIIENHGGQHYDSGFLSMAGKTLQEEQANDKIKQDLATQNNVKHYIVLDCRKSEIDWIKDSVLKSEINDLFDLSLIDFCKCGEFACSNLVKIVADLWNNGLSIKEIIEETEFSSSRVQHYLRRASKCNMCDWTPQESRIRGRKTQKGTSHYMARQVVQLSMDHQAIKVWGYVEDAEKKLGITNICRASYNNKTAGGYRWKYLYDQTRRNGEFVPGAISLGLITEEEALSQLNCK